MAGEGGKVALEAGEGLLDHRHHLVPDTVAREPRVKVARVFDDSKPREPGRLAELIPSEV
jgi:hypothetical protein